MRRNIISVLIVSALALQAAPLRADGPATAAPEVSSEVSLAAVPQEIMNEAKAAVPGAFFKQASWVLKNDTREYRISGSLFRQEVDVYVGEDGKLIRVDKNNLDD